MSKNEEENKEPSQEPAEKPKIYGDYEILKAIGKGKFAVVYRAQRISDGKIVALKRISVDMIDDKARDKCLKEVRLLQSLDHPNIIKYYDSFINENDLVIIFEWAAAGDLKRQLRKAIEREAGFDERIIWKYFSQIADAIQHMHEKRIMHRDLKPANIFLTLDGTVKVGDLGLSRELSENTYQAHSKVGTPLYMSPEVLRGDGYDFKSDIWSIGCLLYELAMLKSPFKSEGLNLYSLFQKISQGEYSPLPERYSSELRELAYSMISTDPEARPEIGDICQTARAMRLRFNEEYVRAKKQQAFRSETPTGGSSNQEREDAGYDGKEEKDDEEEKSPKSAVSKSTAASRSPLDGAKNDESEKDEPRMSTPVMRPQGRREEVDDDRTPERRRERGGEHEEGRSKVRNKALEDAQHSDSSDDTDGPGAQMKRRQGGKNRYQSAVVNRESDGPWTQLNGVSGRDRMDGGDTYNGGGQESRYSRSQISRENERDSMTPQKPVFKPSKSPSTDGDFIPYTKPTPHTSATSASTVQPRRRKKGSAASSPNPVPPAKVTRQVSDASAMSDEDMAPTGMTRTLKASHTGQQGTKDSPTKLCASGVALAQMDILYGKLVALGYPVYSSESSQMKISPVHFVCDLSVLYGGRSRVSFPSTQFGSFVEVALWMVEKVQGVSFVRDIDIDTDPPTTIVKRLLKLAQDCGVSGELLADIPPTSLLQGHGEKVCVLLNALSDCALKHHKWGPIEYPSEGMLEGQAHTESDDDNDVEDLCAESFNEQDFVEAEASGDPTASSTRRLHMSVILPSVDSQQWKEETERVSAALKAGMKSNRVSNSHWGAHVASMREYANKVDPPDNSSVQEGVDISSESITELITGLQRSLLEGVSGIARGEAMLNSNPTLLQLSTQYAKVKESSKELEDRISEISKHIAASSDKLAEAQEALTEVNERLNLKTGENGDGDGGGMLVNLKRAIKTIKEENKEMTIRTGLIHSELMTIRKSDVSLRRRQTAKKSKKSRYSKKNSQQYDTDG
mmetsp:Transcript_23171/g.33972  ORF Transcript_23171/g.33972 Transcript_23171/m.33972 type:complete len:1021 (-) Transcript_23171:170-3232(-)|eukprot:CAMPEP_0185037284 /NCGR_PEP_ID=MMETSP1103-20130426/31451_1 /TAXON_ID=36769 /ORGANISM="Paraphysomonas bandaiensis, Strain Caron Lab Isolate" /LENGTH=1020 /DNA_ID=CAMNT_0027575191 /DNA_START=184 /DNA_END=3246 /DNA_ORIENTATION=-